jgi:hypothetical protein
MRYLITILFICLCGNVFGQTTYYVASNGSDAANGTSTATPWQTLSKVNATTLNPGDQVLLRKGDTFYGTITVSQSGTSGNPITYGAYGSGANPIITGFTTVSAWTNLGSNIWESTSAVSTLSSCGMVTIGGVNTPMGRYPNSGWFTYQSHNTNSSITSSSLDGVINWTGANVAIRRERWFTEVDPITSQSGGTLNFTDAGLGYGLHDNWGFFIENDSRTLDVQNEWYYNPSTKKLRIYSTTSPTNVQIPTLQNCFQDSSNSNYITVNNLTLIGANMAVMDFNFAQNITVNSCDVSYGSAGIMINGYKATITNNNVHDNGYTGISSHINGTGGIITGNTVKRTCPIEGTYDLGAGAGIYSAADSVLIQYNEVDSSGWTGINIKGNVITVKNNFVNYFALTRDDAGGIGLDGRTPNNYFQENVIDNIVLHGIGNDAGTSDAGTPLANGIYFDDLTSNAKASGNTVAYCNGVGQFVHRGAYDTITNNIYYDNGVLNNWTNGQIMFHYATEPITGMDITGNTFFATNSGQNTVKFYSVPAQNISAMGIMDNNLFINLETTNLFNVSNETGVLYTLAGWQTYSGLDAASTSTLPKVATIDSMRLVYNATSSATTIPLTYKYLDVQGNAYNSGSITLQPYKSALLIQNGIFIAPPTISMSGNQSNVIVSNTSVSAVGAPASGQTITGYHWTKTSGPGATSFGSVNSSSTTVTGLQTGVYVLRCTITQSDGQTAYGEVTVTVNIPTPQIINIIVNRVKTIYINH